MKKLWVIFSLRLSLVMLLATILPMLLLYLLTRMELIEASFETDIRTEAANDPQISSVVATVTNLATPKVRRIPPALPTPGLERDPIEALEGLPEMDLAVRLPLFFPEENDAKLVFSTSIFKYRVEMSAWIAIGILMLFSLLVGVLLSLWMSRSITRPFTQLAEAARAIGRRDLASRVDARGSRELHDLAESFNRMADELEQAEATRRNLTADVAHELRTPLAILDGNLRAMLDSVHELNQEEIAVLFEQTHHLKHLVQDLGELSLAESNRLSLECGETDLARLIRETCAHFEAAAREKNLRLACRAGRDCIHPCLDGNRMRQVLHNLLANALKFTPAGGKVSLSANRTREPGEIVIQVSDNGAGIDPHDLPNLFNRFYRAEGPEGKEKRGTGLGLAIVKALVEAQGGTVNASSEGIGMGSTFTIRLPIQGPIRKA